MNRVFDGSWERRYTTKVTKRTKFRENMTEPFVAFVCFVVNHEAEILTR